MATKKYNYRVNRRGFEDGAGRKFVVGEEVTEKDLVNCHPRNIQAMINLGWLEKIEVKLMSDKEMLAEVDKDQEERIRQETPIKKPATAKKTSKKSAQKKKPGRPPKKKIAG